MRGASPSVTDVVQTFSWLLGSHEILYLIKEPSRLTNKSRLNTMKKQSRGLNRYNMLQEKKGKKEEKNSLHMHDT